MSHFIFVPKSENNIIKVLATLIMFLSGFLVQAEGSEVSMNQRFNTLENKSKNTFSEIDEMLRIAEATSIENDALALTYLKKISPKIKKSEYHAAWLLYAELIHTIYQKNYKYAEGQNQINEIFNLYRNKFTTGQRSKILLLQLNLISDQNKHDETISLANELLSYTKDTSLASRVLYLRGHSYQETGRYTDAVNDFLEALERYKSINEIEGIINTYKGLANVKRKLNDHIHSLSYYKQALQYAEMQENTDLKINAYINVGVGYKNADSLSMALTYYQKALDLSEKYNLTENIPRIQLNMGNLYGEMKNYQEALKKYQESLTVCKERGNDYGTFLNYKNIAWVNNLTGNYSSAKIALDSGWVYVERLGAPGEKASIYEEYSNYYKGKGDDKNALIYFRKFFDLKEEIINESTKNAVNELQVKYETAVKDKEIIRISEALEQKKAHTRLLLLILSVIVLPGSFLIFFLVHRNKLLRQLYNRNVELLNAFHTPVPAIEPTDYPQEEPGEEHGLKKIYQNIITLLEKDKIFRDPYLSIADLAEKVGSNEKYVSNAIAECAKINYSNLINLYRVNEAKKLIYENAYDSLQEVMTASGFNSRTTFYNAFNKHTGMSPKQFKDMSAVISGEV